MGYREPFERVLSAAREDAPWAYERLYRSLSPAICGYLRIQGAADPEDLTSEVFLGAFTSITAGMSSRSTPKLDLSACMPTAMPLPTGLPGAGSSPPGLARAQSFFGRWAQVVEAPAASRSAAGARRFGQDPGMGTPVYLEVGSKKIFACALEWPGWARAGKTEEAALEALAAYVERYQLVPEEAGVRFPESAGDRLDVVERVTGDATTDFGAPSQLVESDATPLTKAQADRLASLVEASWTVFDRVVASAPAELRKGPRGGGRDRDKMVAHVVDAEAAYFRKVGVKEGRDAFLTALRSARQPEPDLRTKSWPWRYTARRVAWHVLDHAWEMEDRSS